MKAMQPYRYVYFNVRMSIYRNMCLYTDMHKQEENKTHAHIYVCECICTCVYVYVCMHIHIS